MKLITLFRRGPIQSAKLSSFTAFRSWSPVSPAVRAPVRSFSSIDESLVNPSYNEKVPMDISIFQPKPLEKCVQGPGISRSTVLRTNEIVAQMFARPSSPSSSSSSSPSPSLSSSAVTLSGVPVIPVHCVNFGSSILTVRYLLTGDHDSQVYYKFFRQLKKHSLIKMEQITDICCAHFPQFPSCEFIVNYCGFSLKNKLRFIVSVGVSQLSVLSSLSSLFNSVVWLEREVWEMFGVYFKNNPDLRRMLTDYGFVGHPLRKDFPLSGHYELFYNDEQKRINYVRIELAQEMRMNSTNNG